MLDLIIVKKLLISANLVDLKKSYISFDSNTSYNIIELYLNKENNLVCPICGSKYMLEVLKFQELKLHFKMLL